MGLELIDFHLTPFNLVPQPLNKQNWLSLVNYQFHLPGQINIEDSKSCCHFSVRLLQLILNGDALKDDPEAADGT